MSDKFNGSIAQTNVQFPIETVIEPIAGENYSRALIYMPISKASEYLPGVESPAAGNMIKLDSSNYGAVTGGLLRTWLIPFFNAAQAAVIAIAIFDDGEEATEILEKVYTASKYYAYFKFAITSADNYTELQVALSQLCLPDTLYSALWIGTNDEAVKTKNSALITGLTGVNSNARVIYNPDGAINPALAQLGRSLSTVNTTGTPVGNSVDMVGFSTIKASGADDEEGVPGNLTPTEKLNLDDQKIGYQTYVGDGTENVVTEGSLTLNGDSVGAEWVKNYITYVCKIKTANYLSQMNKFRKNATYQAILLILAKEVKGFLDFGRLADFVITAPAFSKLPKSGDVITVPNAWEASYIDDTRKTTVCGTLYITQPSK